MIKKPGVNLHFFVFIAILFLFFSCTKPSGPAEKGALLKADLDFSAMSEREGMQKAFLDFAADSVVILRDNCFPQVGMEAMKEYFAVRSDTSFTLTWEPLYEKISADGTLGYTYGLYTLTLKAGGEKSRGTYSTVWEKQKDGRWKYVLDSGTQGLPETDLQ